MTITLGINAKDGAVEKAIRGLGVITQGLPVANAGPPVEYDTDELVRRFVNDFSGPRQYCDRE